MHTLLLSSLLIAQAQYPVVAPHYAQTHLYCYAIGLGASALDLTALCGYTSAPAPITPTAPPSPATGARVTCTGGQLRTQSEALLYLPTNPDLDGDGDGVPCENLPP